MVRLFNVYYPVRTLLLFSWEGLIVCGSFLLAALLQFGPDSYLILNYEDGFYKIAAITGLAWLCLYFFDLYDLERMRTLRETCAQLLIVLGTLSLLLAAIGYLFPGFVLGAGVYLIGLVILTAGLFGSRLVYAWLIRQPYLQERVYVVGSGERARRFVQAVRERKELGLHLVGWTGAIGNGSPSREELATALLDLLGKKAVHRVIVAVGDRRGTLPVRELLTLRLAGIKVEDAIGLSEQISGKIEVDELYPSWMIFSDGFRLNRRPLFLRRMISVIVSLACLLMLLPIIPLVILLIKLESSGAALYRQKRVGLNGTVFHCYKFRTMRVEAEADTGATWACDDDPRITPLGRFLRQFRLDEIPQFWNVFRGDMEFVGPRPERPEFVAWLSQEIPYYNLRHIIRPGITGWAQVRYRYGNSVEDAKEKLRFDLFYLKNMSLGLDFLILFETIKIVIFGRGAR